MPPRRHTRKQVTLKYPPHSFKPEDLLHFIEMDGFEADWKGLGLNDEVLTALQLAIMAGAKNSPVVPGTGGLRKMRFAPDTWKTGKSGAARIGFAYFEDYGIVLLIVAYSKSEHDDISAEGKKYIRKMIKEAKKELDRIKVVR